jgi:general stress protein CsbA
LVITIICIYFALQSTFNIFIMEDQKEHLQALSDIRSMMERSSRFISLSGLSGVFAGVFALAGAYLAYVKIGSYTDDYISMIEMGSSEEMEPLGDLIIPLFFIAVGVLVASLLVGTLLTMRNSRKKGIRIWDSTAKRLLINLAIPLATGGLFCLILLFHEIFGLIAPATLIFYGLALINASKYTFNDIRYLGICEIILGLAAAFYIGYGLLFWAVGFGVLHIIYGSVMYFKYERNS